MILLALAFLPVQATARESTPQEEAFCSGPTSDQPYRFCLADRKYERAEKELAVALAAARRGALVQKREIARFSREVGGVTLSGDPVRALEASQRAWERSSKADCEALGLSVATGNAGTEGVTANWECEADRMLDRVRFLARTYPTGE